MSEQEEIIKIFNSTFGRHRLYWYVWRESIITSTLPVKLSMGTPQETDEEPTRRVQEHICLRLEQ